MLVGAALFAGCGASADGVAAPVVPTAPGWVRAYCDDVARIDRSWLCPRALPSGLDPSLNLEAFKPTERGYILEGHDGDEHWAVVASSTGRDVLDDYARGRARQIGVDTVRGEPARIAIVGARAGLLGDHVVVTWREGGVAYVMSVHRNSRRGDDATGQRLLGVAEAMKPAGG